MKLMYIKLGIDAISLGLASLISKFITVSNISTVAVKTPEAGMTLAPSNPKQYKSSKIS